MVVPRAVPPSEPPSLTLDRKAVAAVLAADRRAASQAPKSEAVLGLERLLAAQGRAEVGPGESPRAFQERQAALSEAADRVRRTHGDGALPALRARATGRLAAASAGTLEPKARDGLLGSFPKMLERYGLVVGGERIAPFFVERTLFKARWNTLVHRPPTDGFARAEARAYWGWLALHAGGADVQMRVAALDHYEAADGTRVNEARAVLAHRAGRSTEAARWLDRAVSRHGGLRLRNHALALLP
ncbi:MAG: hypothetical protein ACODAG_02065 [Myxococcota bacterium]